MHRFYLLINVCFLLVFLTWLQPLEADGEEQTPRELTDISTLQKQSRELTASILEGRRLYRRACVACHGVRGNGKGPGSYPLDPKPRDFTVGAYKCRSTPSGSLPTDEDIFKTITRGIHGTEMPTWNPLLSKMQIWNLTEYIKTFSESFREEEPEEPIVISEEIPATVETIAEGKKLYEANKCWECHGNEGKGNGPKSSELEDDWGNRIKPTNFTRGVFRCGDSSADLYRTIVTGMNGTPMPSYADSIQDEKERWHLVHYISSLQKNKNFIDYLIKGY